MTILWIYDQPLRPEAGGTERITALVAKGLTQRGHRCLGILLFDARSASMSWNGEPVTDLYSFLKQHEVDIVINQIAYHRWLLDAFLQRGGAQWKQEGGRLISCLHFDPRNPSLAHLLACNPHKRWKDWLLLFRARLLQPWYTRKQQQNEGAIYNHIYEHSDCLVALSAAHFPYMRKVMKRAESDYGRLVAINNPLTFDDISSPDILQEKKNIVLVCARMSEYHKRISLVLKTWERLQKRCPAAADWTLKLVGDGPDLPAYKEYAHRRRIPRIQFEGQQSPEPYYREARILLVTSSAEGWGLTITEALQRATIPVVMNSSPVFADLITEGSTGFLTPDGDIPTFTHTLAHLMAHSALMQETALNALNAAPRFSFARTMDRWEAMLESLSH